MEVSAKLALPLGSSCIIAASQAHTLEDGERAGVEGGAQTQLTVSVHSPAVRSSYSKGARYGEAWWGGITDLHQRIPRTPSGFSSAWHRARLGALFGLRCLG